jgi:hypothetical protein
VLDDAQVERVIGEVIDQIIDVIDLGSQIHLDRTFARPDLAVQELGIGCHGLFDGWSAVDGCGEV